MEERKRRSFIWSNWEREVQSSRIFMKVKDVLFTLIWRLISFFLVADRDDTTKVTISEFLLSELPMFTFHFISLHVSVLINALFLKMLPYITSIQDKKPNPITNPYSTNVMKAIPSLNYCESSSRKHAHPHPNPLLIWKPKIC